MRKINLLQYIVIAIILGLFGACSGGSTYVEMIPANAETVISIDAKALIQKGQLDKLSELTSIKEKMEGDEKAKKFEEYMNDPRKMGVDITKEMYVFILNNNKTVGYLAALGSASDLEAFLKKIAEEAKKEIKIEEKDGYKYVAIEENFLAWKKGVFVVVGGNDAEATLAKVMKTEAGKGITSNADFKKFLGNKKDVSAWIGGVKAMIEGQGAMAEAKVNGDKLHVHLNFAKGEVILSSNISFKTEVADELKKPFEGQIKQMVTLYKGIEFEVTGSGSVIKLLLSNDSDNSLYAIIKYADENKDKMNGMF